MTGAGIPLLRDVAANDVSGAMALPELDRADSKLLPRPVAGAGAVCLTPHALGGAAGGGAAEANTSTEEGAGEAGACAATGAADDKPLAPWSQTVLTMVISSVVLSGIPQWHDETWVQQAVVGAAVLAVVDA